MIELLVLGAGFTGARVAREFLQREARVVVTTRTPDAIRLAGATVYPLELPGKDVLAGLRELLRPGMLVLHSVPLIRSGGQLQDPTPELLETIGPFAQRIVYLSTTGVYGNARRVDETTPVNAATPRETLRMQAERAVASGPWSWMILRPAAIYGPGRGVHQAMREGRFQLAGDGGNFISRIHVDDLAAHTRAALLSAESGAWPVADDEPCPSAEIARFCADLLGLPMPPAVPLDALSETRRSDRRVDGRAVRKLLGLELKHPSYRAGIPASIAEKGTDAFSRGKNSHV